MFVQVAIGGWLARASDFNEDVFKPCQCRMYNVLNFKERLNINNQLIIKDCETILHVRVQ